MPDLDDNPLSRQTPKISSSFTPSLTMSLITFFSTQIFCYHKLVNRFCSILAKCECSTKPQKLQGPQNIQLLTQNVASGCTSHITKGILFSHQWHKYKTVVNNKRLNLFCKLWILQSLSYCNGHHIYFLAMEA